MDTFFRNRSWLWAWSAVAVIVAAQLFWGLGTVPFIDRDEGEYATVAQGMIQRGDYIIPHVNGRPYYEKPALYFWLMAGSFTLLGQNETAARLPSAVAGLALVFVLGWFGVNQGGHVLGLLAAVFSVTSLLMALLARVAIMDMLLTLWMTLTLIWFYTGYRAPSGQDRYYFWAAWAAMGLAFLTKGPVGAVLPLVTVFVLTIFNGNLWSTIRRAQIPLGLVIFVAIAGPWYGLAFLREGQNFWQGFFVSQNITRFTEVLLGHGAPIWFYLPIMLVGWWPWSIFAIPAGRDGWKTPRSSRNQDPEASLDFFLGIWVITCLVIFSLAQTKQPNYILPAGPPLILLAARWWAKNWSWTASVSKGHRLWGLATVFLGLLLTGALMSVNYLLPISWEKARKSINVDAFEYAFQAQPPDLGAIVYIIGTLVFLTLLTVMIGLRRQQPKVILAGLTFSALILVNGLFHGVAPSLLTYLQTPAKDLARLVKTELKSGEFLGTYGLYKPTLWFYSDHIIERIRSNDQDHLKKFLERSERAWVLSRVSLLENLKKYPRFRLLNTAGGYLLGDNQGDGPPGREGSVQ